MYQILNLICPFDLSNFMYRYFSQFETINSHNAIFNDNKCIYRQKNIFIKKWHDWKLEPSLDKIYNYLLFEYSEHLCWPCLGDNRSKFCVYSKRCSWKGTYNRSHIIIIMTWMDVSGFSPTFKCGSFTDQQRGICS